MPVLSPAQLAALKAAAAGKLSRGRFYPYSWHAQHEDGGGAFAPRSATCDLLIDRGLITLDFEHWDSARWVSAVVTDAGRALLDTPTAKDA